MCAAIVRGLGITAFQVHLNTIGSGPTRERYREALKKYFEPHQDALSDDSRRRLQTNPLRILDSKAKCDRALVAEAPSVVDVLEPEDAAHFDALRRYLDEMKLPYVVDPKLVRGLDYYTRTLFELKITSGELGAQDALLGGGRYDNMVSNLGGKRPVPAIGFAMGLERVLSLTEQAIERPGPDCYFAPMIEGGRAMALSLAKDLRARGWYCEVDGRGASVKAMLRRANSMNSRLALLIGEQELEQKVLTVKDLARRTGWSRSSASS